MGKEDMEHQHNGALFGLKENEIMTFRENIIWDHYVKRNKPDWETNNATLPPPHM